LNDFSVKMDDMDVLTDLSFNSVTFGPEDRGFVYAVARRIVGTPEEADDVTQDTLMTAYRHRAAFRGDSRYRTWLYRIAFTTALGHLRRRARSREALAPTDDASLGYQVADPAPSPESQLISAEQAQLVREAVDELAPPYRDVLVARASHTEPVVAEKLGLSVANVKVRAHRARKQLRDALADVL
jgi:RNA polymerase sigma-70 factor (ECF subfamily)